MEKKQTALNLCSILGKIKDLKRTGWLRRKIAVPESDADHMFSTAFLVMLLTPPELNKEKCLELALSHDLQEIYSGDFVPEEISSSEKYQIEHNAVQKLAQELDYPQLIDLFEEFCTPAEEEIKKINSPYQHLALDLLHDIKD